MITKRFLIAALCIAGVGWLGLWYAGNIAGNQDTGVFDRIGTEAMEVRTGQATTLESEYPPLASSVFFLLKNNPWHVSFSAAWLLFLLGAMIGACVLATRQYGAYDGLLLAGSLLLTVLFLSQELVFARFDILIALLLFLAWRAHARGKPGHGAFFLTVASALKLLPVLVLPLSLLFTPRTQRKQWFVGLGAGAAVSLLVSLWTLGLRGFLTNTAFFLSYHATRGFQAESAWSSADLLLRRLQGDRANFQYHHLALHNLDLGEGWLLVATLSLLIGLGTLLFLAWRRKKKGTADFSAFLFSSLLWILLTSPILSPQYFNWIIPLLFAWILQRLLEEETPSRRTVRILALTVFIAFATQWVFPLHYPRLVDDQALSIAFLLNARTLAMALLIWVLLARPSSSSPLQQPQPHKMKKLPSPRRSRALFAAQLATISVGLVLLAILRYASTANLVDKAWYRFAGKEAHIASLPVFVPTEADTLEMRIPLSLPPLHPTVFRIKPDDCVATLEIDGKKVPDALIAFCDYDQGKSVDLGPYLHAGTNLLRFTLKDSGGLGGLRITVSPRDPLLIGLLACGLLLLGWLLVLLLPFFASLRRYRDALLLFGSGALLRLWYLLSSPFDARGHDVGAHVDYIKYVVQHAGIPAAQDGWEYHQPPLYYYLAAAAVKVQQFLGRTLDAAIAGLQSLSFALSLATLSAGLWIGKLLFPRERGNFLLFGALVATFPTLVFLTSTVSNDVLYQVIAFGFIGVLLHWWKGKGSMGEWYLLVLLLSLGVLTKISASAFGPVLALCLLLRRDKPWKWKMKHATLGVLLLILLAGWMFALRLLVEPRITRFLSLGNEGMSGQLEVRTSPRSFLTFDPIAILLKPYNSSWDDTAGRQYFWEYFFKSMFFGEWTFPAPLLPASATLMVFALLSVPLAALGFLRSLRRRFAYDAAPLLLLSALLLLSSLAYRLRYPYAPNQDFRFVLVLLVPYVFFAIRGIDTLPAWLQKTGRAVLWGLAAACALFLFLLFFVS